MKPPLCELCGRAFAEELAYRNTGGDVVEFADYTPLPQGMTGHPQGLVWLCDRHLAAGRALASQPWPQARAQLVAAFGRDAAWDPESGREPELWVKAVGPRRFAVVAIAREAAGLAPVNALRALLGRRFRVMRGSATELERWRVRLVEAGADAQIEFP